MMTLQTPRWLAVSLVALHLGVPQSSHAETARDVTIRAAVAAAEPRVVQLRYFGDAGGGLGSAAPTMTGYEIGDGWVLTSLYALAEDPAAILCQRPGAEPIEARVVARDHSRALALLSVGTGDTPPPEPTGRAATVGETAIALGRVYEAGTVNLAVGVVSAIDRLGGRALQTDAAISPTNYGGPLIGLDGGLLGIITPLAPPGQSGVGLYDSGVGFAVPPEQIAGRLPQLAAGGDVRPGWLGVGTGKDDPLRSPAGVVSLVDDGPAMAAGLRVGDVITSLGGLPTPTAWVFRRRLSGMDAGRRTLVEAVRDEMPIEPIAVTLSERPDPAGELTRGWPGRTALPGAEKNQPDQP